MKSGIYQIKNTRNGKAYIGSTSNLVQRKCDHFKALRKGIHPCRHLQNAFTKYGETAFEFTTLLLCEVDELLVMEQGVMDMHVRSWLYNASPWAARIRHTEETKELIRQSKMGERNAFYGKRHTAESRAKMSATRKGHTPWNRGKKATQEHRDKISASGIGRIQTEQTKEKRKATLLRMVREGRLFTPEHLANLSKGQRRRHQKMRTDL